MYKFHFEFGLNIDENKLTKLLGGFIFRVLFLEIKNDAEKREVKGLKTFITCDVASTMKIMTCDMSKMVAKCRGETQFCAYAITCPIDARKGVWSCDYEHKFTTIECCDYDC